MLKRAGLGVLCLSLLGLLGAPIGAAAGTVFDFTSGTAVLSATVVDLSGTAAPTPILLNGSPSLNVAVVGDSVEFDSAAPAIDDFTIVLADTGVVSLSTTTASDVFGYVSAQIDGLTITPGAGYDGTAVAGGPANFSFDVGPVDISGTVSASSGSPPTPPDVVGAAFAVTSPSLAGSLTLAGNTLEILGITFGGVVNPANDQQVVVFKGDITFNGSQPVIPEPTSALLFALGAGAVAVHVRRRLAS